MAEMIIPYLYIPLDILCDVFHFLDGILLMEVRIICKKWKSIIETNEEVLPLSPLKYQLKSHFHPHTNLLTVAFFKLYPENKWINLEDRPTLSYGEALKKYFQVPRFFIQLELWLDRPSFEFLSSVVEISRRPIHVQSLEVTLDNYFDFLNTIKEFFTRIVIPLEKMHINLMEQNLMNLFLRNPLQIPIPVTQDLTIRCCMAIDPDLVNIDQLVNFIFQENATFGVCNTIYMPSIYAVPYKNFLLKFTEKFFHVPIPLACFKQIDIDISEEVWKNWQFRSSKLGDTFIIERPDGWRLNVVIREKIHSRGTRSVVFSTIAPSNI